MSATRVNPEFSQSQAAEITTRLYGLSPCEMKPLPSYIDQNFYLTTKEGGEYVLKIFNFEDSKNPKRLEVQMEAVAFLRRNGVPVPTAVPSVSGPITSLEEADFGCGCQKYLVILLTFLPGMTISKAPLTPRLLFEVGRTAARMDTLLQKFQHPDFGVLRRDDFFWSLSNVLMLEAYLKAVDGDPLKDVAEGVLHQFRTLVIPKRSSFRRSLIHGDFSDLNVLAQPDGNGGHAISGILDFAHLNWGCYVYEVAISIMYMMLEHPDPIEVGGFVLAGFESVLPLNEAERECLYTLVMSRFCQSCVFARYLVVLQPENAEYVMITSKKGVSIIHRLWELGKEEVERAWFRGAAQYTR